MIAVHCLRRLWESFFVSIYSDTEMNIFHYIVGCIHYLILPPIVVSEVRGMANQDRECSLSFSSLAPILAGVTAHFSIAALSWIQFFSLTLFLLSSFMQYRCAAKLAAMRRNHLG
jgi:hypothetical protein